MYKSIGAKLITCATCTVYSHEGSCGLVCLHVFVLCFYVIFLLLFDIAFNLTKYFKDDRLVQQTGSYSLH